MMFAPSRHGPRPSFSQNKFFNLTITLNAMTICGFVENSPGQVSKIHRAKFKIRTATFQFHGAELQTCTACFILLGLGCHLGPASLAVNTSYFALFSLILCVLVFFLMQTVPIDKFLHFATMQRSWDD